jgi:ATP-binding cassette subfamily F protein 3
VNKELEPQSGRIAMGGMVQPGTFSQHLNECLHQQSKVLQEVRRLCPEGIREEEFRSVLGLFLLGESTWDRPVSDLSGGEKNRLMLASLFLSRANFLILDEPTNHLDLESRQALTLALQQFQGTILMVAHDRTLLQEVPDELWELGRQGIQVHGVDAYLQSLSSQDSDRTTLEDTSGSKRERARDRRRQEAEQRNQLYRELKPMKKRYSTLEKELEQLMSRQEDLESQLADPSTYEDRQLVEQANKEYAAVLARNEDILDELEQLEHEIAVLDPQRGCADNPQ